MQIVNLHDTQKLQVSLFDVLISSSCISCAHLKEAVQIALIDYTENVFIFPAYAGTDDFDRLFARALVPDRADKVIWNVHVNVLRLGRFNHELLCSVVEI